MTDRLKQLAHDLSEERRYEVFPRHRVTRTHDLDRYPHNDGGNADLDLLCRACEMGVPMKRAMPGPPEHDRYARPHRTFAEDYCYACWAPGWVPPKRLSDAEAAAEYWRASHDALDYHDVHEERILAMNEAATWHRFATLPHALKETI